MFEVLIGMVIGALLIAGIAAFAVVWPARHNRRPETHHEDWRLGPPNDP